MSTVNYQIMRWDGIISSSDLPLPSISFIPNNELLNQLEANKNNRIQITISGTNSRYDDTWLGIIDCSANVPSCRRNFYDASQYWVITLLQNSENQSATWQGPPSNYGTFTIVNGVYKSYQNLNDYKTPLNKAPVVTPKISPTKPKATTSENNNGNKKNNLDMIIWVIIILIIIAIISSFFAYKQSKK
jgi:hypothetical protein